MSSNRAANFLLITAIICLHEAQPIVAGDPLQDFAKTFMNLTGNSDLKKILETPVKLLENQAKFLENPTKLLNPANLLTQPKDVLESAVEGTKNLSDKTAPGLGIGNAADSIKDVALAPTKVADVLSDITPFVPKLENVAAYFNKPFADDVEEFRRPNYFSRECEFRLACELGKVLKPVVMKPVTDVVKTNKIVNNLQNRYTRAMTFGILYNDCRRYYCLLLQLMGKPKQFVSGLAELVNRMANPELYENENIS